MQRYMRQGSYNSLVFNAIFLFWPIQVTNVETTTSEGIASWIWAVVAIGAVGIAIIVIVLAIAILLSKKRKSKRYAILITYHKRSQWSGYGPHYMNLLMAVWMVMFATTPRSNLITMCF